MRLRFACRFLASVTLFHMDQPHILSSGLLDVLCKFADLRTLLLVGSRHFHRQQMPEFIHGNVHLAAFAALVAIIA